MIPIKRLGHLQIIFFDDSDIMLVVPWYPQLNVAAMRGRWGTLLLGFEHFGTLILTHGR